MHTLTQESQDNLFYSSCVVVKKNNFTGKPGKVKLWYNHNGSFLQLENYNIF